MLLDHNLTNKKSEVMITRITPFAAFPPSAKSVVSPVKHIRQFPCSRLKSQKDKISSCRSTYILAVSEIFIFPYLKE